MPELADTLRRLISGLDRLDLAAAKADGLTRATKVLCETVTESLSVPPGGPHEYPWLRTGELRASVGVSADGDVAVVGSVSDVAVYQEQGTRKLPPRPFLAPNAAREADAMAQTVGRVVLEALADALRVSAR